MESYNEQLERTTEAADTFNLRKWATTLSASPEDKEPITRPSKRTGRDRGGPAWSTFGHEVVIPTPTRTSRIDILILKKSLIFPCEL